MPSTNITNLTHPYPNFQQGAIMSESEFNSNNQATRDKVNEIISVFNPYPDVSNIVTKDGNNVFTGTNSFSNDITFSGTIVIPTPVLDYQAATKKYVDDAILNVNINSVTLTGDQSVDGVKTFTERPIVPTPNADYEVANKRYVDINSGYSQVEGDRLTSQALQPVAAFRSGNDYEVNIGIIGGFVTGVQDGFFVILGDGHEAPTSIGLSIDGQPLTYYDNGEKVCILEEDCYNLIHKNGTTYKLIRPKKVDNILTYTGSLYLQLSNFVGKYIRMNNTSNETVSIFADSTVNLPIGSEIEIMNIGTFDITIVGLTGVTLNSKNGYTKIDGQYGKVTLKKVAANTWDLFGDLKA